MHPDSWTASQGVLNQTQRHEYQSKNSSNEPPVRRTGHARLRPSERGKRRDKPRQSHPVSPSQY